MNRDERLCELLYRKLLAIGFDSLEASEISDKYLSDAVILVDQGTKEDDVLRDLIKRLMI